jgi:hypothetical protein
MQITSPNLIISGGNCLVYGVAERIIRAKKLGGAHTMTDEWIVTSQAWVHATGERLSYDTGIQDTGAVYATRDDAVAAAHTAHEAHGRMIFDAATDDAAYASHEGGQ